MLDAIRDFVAYLKNQHFSYLVARVGFYAILSFLPTLLLLLVVTQLIVSNAPGVRDNLLDSVWATFPLFENLVRSEVKFDFGVGLLSAATLIWFLWSARKLVIALFQTLQEIWNPNTTNRMSHFQALRITSVAVVVAAFTIVIYGYVLARASNVGWIAVLVLQTIAATVVLVLLYKAALRVDVTKLLPGATAAGLCLAIMQFGSTLYVRYRLPSVRSSFGQAAILSVIPLWIALGISIALLGCALNAYIYQKR